MTPQQGADMARRQAAAWPRVLRADGQRLDLTSRDVGTRLALVRQEWQNDAWTYRDMIGELRYAQRLLARSVAQLRFFAAEIVPGEEWPDLSDPDDSTTLDKRLAAEAVDNLNRLPLGDGPDGFIATMVENLETAGECWIHGQDTDLDEVWTIRSVSEIVGQGDQVMLAELPTTTTVGQRKIDPQTEQLLRCWTRHPRWGQLADSPLRAMIDVLEEVVLTGREMRAAARSRIASNGVLLVPATLELLRTREMMEALEADGIPSTDFMRDFTEALTAPIRNEGDPGSVVPLIIRGDPEALKEFRHVSLTRDDAEKLMDRLQGAVLRMLQGLDIQPEQVQGIGNVNHWGGWQIEASNVRHQVLPMGGIVAGCIVKAFLRPALEALGHDPAQVRRIGIGIDPTQLVESPDRGQDARDAWDRDVISNTALRQALGFSDDDAPEPHEHLVRLLTHGRLTPEAVPLVAALAGVSMNDERIQAALDLSVGLSAKPAAPALPPGQPANGARPAAPNQVVPEKPAPTPPPANNQPPSAIAAAAAPPEGWRVDPGLSRALTEIDAHLIERILTAADAGIARAVERAGGKARNAVRNTTRRDPTLAALLEGVDTVMVPSRIGRDRLAEFVPISDLIAGAYERIRDQFDGWLADAAARVADVVLQILGLRSSSPAGKRARQDITSRYAMYRGAAWQTLLDAMNTAAERSLFRVDPLTPEPGHGEAVDTLLAPGDVIRALTVAGGGAADRLGDTGFATGPVVRDVIGDSGGVLLGWEWRYRPELPRRSHFLPHLRLDGTRFSTWTDPKLEVTGLSDWLAPFFRPGDHRGCFVAGTVVSGPPALGSFVRPYVGEGVELRTDSGKVLTGTPNHPVLTPRGWVPLGDLAEGGEVVVASSGKGALPIDNEAHQVPALIEDVAATLPMASGVVTGPVPTSPEDFHGDGAGSDGQITVVRADSSLLLHREATTAQFSGDDMLQLGGEHARTLSTKSVFDALVPGERFAAHGSVRGAGDSGSLISGSPDIPVVASGAAVSRFNPGGNQDPTDRGPGQIVPLSQSEFAGSVPVRINDDGPFSAAETFGRMHAVIPGQSVQGGLTDAVPSSEDLRRFTVGVETEKISEIVRIQLDCHVYNLTTTTGWYMANGVIVHNCRCSSVPLFAVPEADPDDIVGQRIREAAASVNGRLATQVAAEDTAAGRVGTTIQNEVEIRDRVLAGIQELQAHYIGRSS